MIDSAALLADLKKQLKLLQADLRPQAENASTKWGARLREQHREATERERTSQPWVEWRDNQVDQAAVAWILACVFMRFCEDNGLLDGARDADGRAMPTLWLAGPDGRTARAVENQTEFVRGTAYNVRDWMLHAFGVLADQPAGAALLDRQHNLVWSADVSAEAAGRLAAFWRATADGELVHDFTDASLDTRFLGDLYQDLSEHARSAYALLQTPDFVEEFILDRTLTPAIERFGLSGLRLIDPACGSGHFLLGAFSRLDAAWLLQRPGMPPSERVGRVLASLHGVDINPFATAIARFRLALAAMAAGGWRSFVEVPALPTNLATGDSLLGAVGGRQSEIDVLRSDLVAYPTEDLFEQPDILRLASYHVVVGNPPYTTVRDAALSRRYRMFFEACSGKYAQTVPFMELFYRLAVRSDRGAGFVGQITSNSFSKREFGKKLVTQLLAGKQPHVDVDLTHVVDTSGAYIPGHGTPTVIIIGQRRRPVGRDVRAVLGVRGEPGQPSIASDGLVWKEIVSAIDEGEYNGTYVTVAEVPREVFASHPWSLSGGGASKLMASIESRVAGRVGERAYRVGVFGIMGADDCFMLPVATAKRLADADLYKPLVVGDQVRDYGIVSAEPALFPYDKGHALRRLDDWQESAKRLWPLRTELGNRATFSKGTYFSEGRPWFEWHQLPKDPGAHELTLCLAFVSTHNHFVLERGGKAFKQSAPIIKLPASATEQDYLDLLAVLNASVASFWLKQVSYEKGAGSHGEGIADEVWEWRYEFSGTKVQRFPLPSVLPGKRGGLLDGLASLLGASMPTAVLAETGGKPVRERVEAATAQWHDLRAQMIFEQEELDWEVYRLYGLVNEDLTYGGDGARSLALGERAFEVVLARELEAGKEETAWFERHGSTPITELPAHWPDDYRALVQRRLDVIAEDSQIALLERPEHKRRWATPGWDRLLKDALEEAILDRLEDPSLWRDDSEVQLRTVAQVATSLRHDRELRELVTLYTGTSEHDMTAVLTTLVADQAVPYLAAHRYKEAGVEKYRAWQEVWALQRQEDAGRTVDVPVPPKYTQADFRSTPTWRNRGKLDVPKERFIAYPGVGRPGDRSPLLGWAGWSQEDQAIALARELTDQEAEGAGATVLEPMVAGLVELEPWLHQWHTDGERGNAAESITGFLDQQLEELGNTRADVDRWRPEPARRGRRPRS